MRLLLSFTALMVLSSCTCGGCRRAFEATDAGPAVTVTNAGPTGVMAAATEPTDGAVTLPSEVTENAPSTEALIAAFAANCHHQVTLSFEDMDGTHPDAGECDARMFEQNCSPDTFGCWEGVEKCRDACADRCDSCKTRCSGASACLTACAKTRVDCRVQCLGRLETCRTATCDAAMSRCEAEAQVRLKRLCPDCDAITKCQLEASERDQDVKRCAAKFFPQRRGVPRLVHSRRVTLFTLATWVALVANAEAPARLVEVPEGDFVMGRDWGGNDDEHPAHRVHVAGFSLDATLVTVVTSAERLGYGMVAREGLKEWEWVKTPGAWWRAPFGPSSIVIADDWPVTSTRCARAPASVSPGVTRRPKATEASASTSGKATTPRT